MQFKVIVVVRELVFKKTINHIVGDYKCLFVEKSNNSNIINETFSAEIKNVLGMIYIDQLKGAGLILIDFNIPIYSEEDRSNSFSDISSAVGSYFQTFFHNLWFKTDNSIYVEEVLCFSDHNFVIRQKLFESFSNCKGQHLTYEFDEEDYDFVLNCYNDLFTQEIPEIKEEKYTFDNRSYYSDPSNQLYTSYNRIERAKRFLLSARSEGFLPAKIQNYMSILESLFVLKKDKITAQIKNSVINFIDDVEGEKFSKKQISKCYEIRSAYVHGSLTIKRDKIEKSLDIIDEICRRVFIKIYSDVNIYKTFISNDNNKDI
ncbi:hypothetical protein [Enterococcus sp. N249-2]